MTRRPPDEPMSIEEALSDRLMGATLKRALIRAYMADELTVDEIAAEFGCSEQYVRKVTAPLREMRCGFRRRRKNLGGRGATE